MFKKLVFLCFITGMAGNAVFAQNINDLVRASHLQFSGTARYNAMQGAFGALGADPSVSATNPGGLGIFRRSEVSITANLAVPQSTTELYNSSASDASAHFLIDHFSAVITNPTNRQSGVMQQTFAFGVNRLQDFHQTQTFNGVNNESSLLDVYLYDINYPTAIHPDDINLYPELDFGAALAWNAYAIDTLMIDGVPEYFSYNMNYGATQEKEVVTSGGLNEWYLSYGADINHRFFVGATVGIDVMNYFQTTTYTERISENDVLNPLDYFTQIDSLEIKGFGINLKTGVVYRASDHIRIGAAVHTPTRYSLRDTWGSDFKTLFDSTEVYTAQSPLGEYSYTLTTPWRYFGSFAYFFGDKGLISIDYEYQNVPKAKLGPGEDDYLFQQENEQRSLLNPSHCIRAGSEVRSGRWSYRAGGMWRNKAYIDDYASSSWGGSLGAGFRDSDFYVDMTYALNYSSQTDAIYDPAFVASGDTRMFAHRLMVTVGLRWY